MECRIWNVVYRECPRYEQPKAQVEHPTYHIRHSIYHQLLSPTEDSGTLFPMKRILTAASGAVLMLSICIVSVAAQEPQEVTSADADPLGFGSRPEAVRINQQDNVSVRNHFRVGPARNVIRLTPGSGTTVDVSILNLLGKDALFVLSTEDFTSDNTQQGAATFFGAEGEGPYPAKLWMRPEVERIPLHQGERAYVRVNILVPRDAEPGDHQAALLVYEADEDVAAGGFRILSRVASLFIITVEGEVIEDTRVLSIRAQHRINWSVPLKLVIKARNDGTVHSIPAGTIEIRNIFGAVVDEIVMNDWIVLRNSERERELTWDPRFALGYYRATANLMLSSTLGESLSVPVSTGFWVIPLLPVLLVLFAIFLVSFLVQFFFSRFEIQRKKGEKSD